MIGQQSKSFLARTLQQQQRYGALVQASQRGFAGGGPKKPAIGADVTDFDVICIGKLLNLDSLSPARSSLLSPPATSASQASLLPTAAGTVRGHAG